MCSFERYTLYFYLFEISYCCTIHQIQLGSKWVKLCAPKEEKEKKIILENNLFYSDRLMFYHWLNVLACIVYCIQWFNLSFFYSIKNYTTLFQKLEQKNPIEFNAEYYSLFIPFFFTTTDRFSSAMEFFRYFGFTVTPIRRMFENRHRKELQKYHPLERRRLYSFHFS